MNVFDASALLAFLQGEEGSAAVEAWKPGTGLSLAGRLCLALGQRLDAIVWTADTSWGSNETIRQIR